MSPERRLPLAIGASLLVNAAVWTAAGAAFADRAAVSPPAIEIQRVIIRPDGRKIAKVVKPEEVRRKVERIVREHRLVPPRTPPKPVSSRPKPAKRQAPQTTAPKPAHAAPPQGAHSKVITAKPAADAPAKPQDFTALSGGNAPVGRPTEAQAPGTAATNPSEPPKVAPPPAETKPDAKPTTAPPADPGPKTETKPVEAPPPQPSVAPIEKPKKKGPSREAQHSNEVNPTIPEELKGQEFKKFVRVRVDIAADGAFTVTLRTSSGNDEVDRRVLEALKRWTWKPRLVEGEPVESTQLFRFDFEIK